MTYREYMALAERQYFNALSAAGMPISKMASHAGLNRPSLYKRLRRIGLNVSDLPRNARYGNRGNETWRRLTAESRITP
jgi:DNA-binding NtrC family response regulator